MGPRPTFSLPPPFDEALRRHQREIMRFLLRMTGDREDALDLFQETWLRAYRAYPSLDSEDGLRPWLFRIASNLCRNRTRDASRRSQAISLPAQAFSGYEGPKAGACISAENALDLRRAIQSLPGKQGQAFVMRKFIGLAYKEIGEALGCSPQSARAGVYQALKKLKALR